ncbi:ABC transporter substrate-binding protein [Nocardia nova]|uniref:ABC transporter substrate-binding protein n=1 Tax=Nocardia nova TaxID=37330 RepID=A0A2S6AX37_9NOCA|nr:ABC transporter substrate-binding protein [Nocardia nova]PPJ39744.1 ABC transporter substrate-binding protein [Nocardia nova]
MSGRIRAALSVFAAGTAAAVLLTACGSGGSAHTENGVTSLRYLGWTDRVTLPELAENLGFFDGTIKLDYVGNTISGPQEIQTAATGQVDFGGAFAGAVAKLAGAGAPITAVVNYYGSDEKSFQGYYTLDNSPIHSAADLVGKKVGVNTLGGQNEADIHDALKKAGLSVDQIKSVQLVALPPPNIEQALRQGQIDAAALNGQFQQRAVANGGVRPIFTELDEYGGPINGGPYVFRNDFIAKNPDVVRTFTTGVAKAIEWERSTPRDQVIAKFTDIINARHRTGEDTSTLKYWLSVGVPARYGTLSDEDFTRWQSWLEDTGAIDHKLDPSKFYTNKFNSLLQSSDASGK